MIYNAHMDFWKEFQKLRETTPRAALFTTNVQNSPYTNFCVDSKNCHLLFAAAGCEDCYYGVNVINSKDCVDVHNVRNCTLCYGCIDCENCYNGNFLQDCRDSVECSYCFDCIGCESCFGSTSLRHKKYYIFNEPYTKEGYAEKMKEIKQWPRQLVEEKFNQLKLASPRSFARQINVENSFGDYLTNTKNCYFCFDAKEAEDCVYCDRPFGAKDCVDTANLFRNSELCYQVMSSIELHNANFCYLCWYGHDLEYAMYCFNSSHLFGCISLSRKEYYILNKPYGKEEWHKKVAEIKDQMRAEGSYGRMLESDFPVEDSILGDYMHV